MTAMVGMVIRKTGWGGAATDAEAAEVVMLASKASILTS
jgi:hypothetical protein